MIAAFDRSTATAGGFPYGVPGSQPLAVQEINFDPASGQLIDYEALSIELPNGQRMSFDLTGSIAEPDITPVMPVTTRYAFDLSSLQPVYEPQPIGIVAPSSNSVDATFHGRTSAIAIGNLGQEVPLDIYFAKLENGLWEVSVFDASNGHSFPYDAPALASQFMSFDPGNGRLLDGGAMTFSVPGGQETTLDLSRFSELALDFRAYADGNDGLRPSFASDFEISEDGIVYALYGSGERKALYQIALANVASADQLSVHAGNVFAASAASGEMVFGTATNGSFGKIVSGALEASNVDIAEELTSMIEAQRNYTANSKVFQTGSELLDVLVNLKR
jgi:flagellar hook-basal body protein